MTIALLVYPDGKAHLLLNNAEPEVEGGLTECLIAMAESYPPAADAICDAAGELIGIEDIAERLKGTSVALDALAKDRR